MTIARTEARTLFVPPALQNLRMVKIVSRVERNHIEKSENSSLVWRYADLRSVALHQPDLQRLREEYGFGQPCLDFICALRGYPVNSGLNVAWNIFAVAGQVAFACELGRFVICESEIRNIKILRFVRMPQDQVFA